MHVLKSRVSKRRNYLHLNPSEMSQSHNSHQKLIFVLIITCLLQFKFQSGTISKDLYQDWEMLKTHYWQKRVIFSSLLRIIVLVPIRDYFKRSMSELGNVIRRLTTSNILFTIWYQCSSISNHEFFQNINSQSGNAICALLAYIFMLYLLFHSGTILKKTSTKL